VPDTVYSVNPTGPVRKGEKITVKVYGSAVTPDAPATAPTATPAATAQKKPVTINWTAQSCPSGQNLSGYEVLAEGQGAESPAPVGADTTSAVVTTGPETGTFTVKFRYFCGDTPSPYSPSSTPVTVTAVP